MAIEVYLYEPFNASKPDAYLMYSTHNPKEYDFAPGVIKDEVNKAGSFEFDIYPNHPAYKRIKSFSVYIGVLDSGQNGHESVLFYGRIINFTIDIYGAKHAICEGLLANLLDCPAYMPDDLHENILSIKSQGTYWLFMYPINAYKDLLNRDDIYFGDVDYALRIMSDDVMEYKNSLTQSSGDFIISLLDTFGGILDMRYYLSSNRIDSTLSWRTDPISEPNRFPLNSQTFKIGENIISASFDNADSNKVEGVFSYAACTDNEGKEFYVYFTHNQSGTSHRIPTVTEGDGSRYYFKKVRIYPIKTVQLEGVDDGNGSYSYENFWDRNDKYAKLHCGNYVNDVTVNAVDEYFIGKASRRIHLMDRVHVVVPYADYDETKYCLSYELDIANPANSQFKFGDYKPVSSQKAYYISTHISGKKK